MIFERFKKETVKLPVTYEEFFKEDQKLFKQRDKDYVDENQPLTKWKNEFEKLDDTKLTPRQMGEKYNSLWIWHHHASQSVFNKDPVLALEYVNLALCYKEKIQHPNQITPLLRRVFLGLYHSEDEETKENTKKIIGRMSEGAEKTTAENWSSLPKETQEEITRWKKKLDGLDDAKLTPEQAREKYVWYQNASEVVHEDGNKKTALQYIDQALDYQEKSGETDNKITQLLKLLYSGQHLEAEEIVHGMPDTKQRADGNEKKQNKEKEVALYLLKKYRRHGS